MSVLSTGSVLAPLAVFLLLGASSWFGWRLSERVVTTAVVLGIAVVIVGAAEVCLEVARHGHAHGDLGLWFGSEHHKVRLAFEADWVSAPFALTAAVLCGVIAVFAGRYLHREPGYLRFHLLLSLFVVGVECVARAAHSELLIVGWELTGITSALLISFFHTRPGPVAHGLRAFITYRVCDVGLFAGLLLAHRHAPPVLVGLLLLWAAMGKAAQFPIGEWLPRAMEGPTPSSALFYGAVSVALGPLLLLRTHHEWAASHIAHLAIILVGAVTAGYATLIGRTQPDVKSTLAYACMAHMGLVMVEIGLGWTAVAVIHLLTHAAYRGVQVLRSPSAVREHRESTPGGTVPGLRIERLLPSGARSRWYRVALERGYVDDWLIDRLVGGPIRRLRRAHSIRRR